MKTKFQQELGPALRQHTPVTQQPFADLSLFDWIELQCIWGDKIYRHETIKRAIKDSIPWCLCIVPTARWIKETAPGIRVVSRKRTDDEGLEMDFGLLTCFTFI